MAEVQPPEAAKEDESSDRLYCELDAAHREELVRFARAVMPNELRGALSAEDIVQQAFLATLATAKNPIFRALQPGQRRAWLYTATRNLLRTSGRDGRRQKRGAGRAASPDALADVPAQSQPSPSQEAMGKELLDRLPAALERLTPLQKRVLSLRAAGHSSPVIADLLDLTVDAVDQHLHRARTSLADTLHGGGRE